MHEPDVGHEEVREIEDDRHRTDAADAGVERFEFGFLQFPQPGVETLPAEDAPSGRVIPGVTPADEYKLYTDLYAAYGHPSLDKLKVAFAWVVCGIALAGLFWLPAGILTASLAAIVGVLGAAYIMS